MKQFSTFLNGVFAAILIGIAVFSFSPRSRALAHEQVPPTAAPTVQPASACDINRSIQVKGTAVLNVAPDRVLIEMGVESDGRTAAIVQSINATTIEKVTKAIRDLGVEAQDITSDWYVIEPLYEDYSSIQIKGYRINDTVAITLRNVHKTNDVINAAIRAGANTVINVELYTSELRKYRDQARDMAMKAAVEKAQALAQAAGAETGCVLNINENTWSYYNGGMAGNTRSQNIWTQNVSQNAAPMDGETGALSEAGPVSLGNISVKAEVSASFSLK
jgi:uncharacterized protein